MNSKGQVVVLCDTGLDSVNQMAQSALCRAELQLCYVHLFGGRATSLPCHYMVVIAKQGHQRLFAASVPGLLPRSLRPWQNGLNCSVGRD
jgi:hypothetical protein